MSLFADRGRGQRIAAALLVLLATGLWYSWWAIHATVGFQDCWTSPATHDGRELVFPLWEVTRIVGPDRYEISKVVHDVPIAGPTEGLRVGSTVSVVGTFSASDLAVHQTLREVHTLRPYKEALGVIGTVLVLVAAPFCFRVEGRRLVERRRG